MKKIVLLCLSLMMLSCKTYEKVDVTVKSRSEINILLDNWHNAAAKADFDTYFSLMTKEGIFIGTDPTENWQNEAFRSFSKPYFDKGKAWDFTSIERNIYFSDDLSIAWFDELLDTQMKICRGSGILKLENGKWKIAHYVLSMTIPNDNIDEVIKIKKDFDDKFMKGLSKKE